MRSMKIPQRQFLLAEEDLLPDLVQLPLRRFALIFEYIFSLRTSNLTEVYGTQTDND
jgi:hypothetical protein